MDSGNAENGRSALPLAGLCGALAALVGCLALIGWDLGRELRADAMVPSIAALLVLYGAATALRAHPSTAGATRWHAVVPSAGALIALALLVPSLWGIHSAGAPHAHLSPIAAGGLVLVSLSLLASLPTAAAGHRRAAAGWWLACVLLGACLALLLASFFGLPVPDQPAFVPPPPTFLLALAALSLAAAVLAATRLRPTDPAERNAGRLAPALVVVSLFVGTGIVAAGYLHVRNASQAYRARVDETLESVAELKVRQIATYRRERLGDALVFFHNPAFSSLAARFFDAPADAETAAELENWLARVQQHYQYDRITVFDAAGVERMAIPRPAIPVAKAVRRRAAEALQAGQVELLDFHLNEHDNRVYLSTAIPILDGPSWSRRLGIIMARIDPQSYLYKTLGHWPTPSRTGETFLARREGQEVVVLSPLRFQADAPLALRFPLTREDMPMVKAALGQRGIVEGTDYRGEPVIAAVSAVPDSPWLVIARMDTAEMLAPLRRQMWMTIALIIALLAGGGAGIGAVWRRQRAQFYRERFEAQQERAWLWEVIARGVHELWMFDPDTLRFSFVNRGACRNIGYTAEELSGMTPLDVKPEFTEATFRELLRPLRDGEREVIVFETDHRRKDGSTYPVEVHLQRVAMGDRAVMLALITDITQRRRLEADLRHAQRMEAVGRLAGGIAHDFNNQIFVIDGYCDLVLGDRSLPPAIRGAVEQIQRAARQSGALTAQLLAFSRRQLLRPKVLDLNAELQSLEPMLRRLIGEPVQLAFLLGTGLGRVKVDPSQLQQVIVNLALNARDAMPDGGQLTIETTAAELDESYATSRVDVRPGRYVLLSVSDTGMGMDVDTLARAFEPFFTTKEPGRGTGLGLATVHGIVKQSGGHVAAYSEVAHGTTVKVYLPRVDEPLDTLEPSADATRQDGTETILVVEDDAAVRTLLVRILAERGYRVLAASGGQEALTLAAAERGPIHLLLTDVVMPEMNGSRLAELLHGTRPETRVLYMSGYTENAIVRHGVLEEGLAFVPKPCPADVLVRRVRQLLDARPAADLRGRRILLVDDLEPERELEARLLEKAGCTVVHAASGPEALAALARERVDAVLTDVNMPGMSGLALTEAIRRAPELAELPVIVLSGAVTARETERARQAGATECVEKGAHGPESLLGVLVRVLAPRR